MEEAMGLVMEYVECVACETVAQRLERDGIFPLSDAIRVLRSAADALNRLHWIGILHRDLKPQSILLESGGVVKLLDFGAVDGVAFGTPCIAPKSSSFT